MHSGFAKTEPTRAEIDAMRAPAVIEFGASWCGYCQAARPLIDQALTHYPGIHHIKIEDGPGRRLGRSFKIKLWPTLIFISQGQEVGRLVRPTSTEAITQCLTAMPEPINPGAGKETF